jgi:hypothetical protein
MASPAYMGAARPPGAQIDDPFFPHAELTSSGPPPPRARAPSSRACAKRSRQKLCQTHPKRR